ncbi:MAG TPA: TetR/AcrR family transcriptional regulator [Smithella sp.]|nr:TetR/AcrR family transcriptional regulator [Smithella sp.]
MPRVSVKEQRRLQILEALNDCLITTSFSQTSIKDIAKKAKVNHGVLHYYFKSKEDILLNYIDFIIEKYLTIFTKWIVTASKKYPDQKVFIEESLKFINKRVTLDRNISIIFIEIWEISLYNKKVRQKLKQMYKIWEQTVTDEFAKVVKDKKVAKRLSIAMIAFFEGISLFSIVFDGREYDWKDILDNFNKLVLKTFF